MCHRANVVCLPAARCILLRAAALTGPLIRVVVAYSLCLLIVLLAHSVGVVGCGAEEAHTLTCNTHCGAEETHTLTCTHTLTSLHSFTHTPHNRTTAPQQAQQRSEARTEQDGHRTEMHGRFPSCASPPSAAVKSHALAKLGTPMGAAEVDQHMAGKQQGWRRAEARADGESNNSARCTAGRHQEKRHSQGHMRKQSTSKRPPSACPQKSRFDPDFGPFSGR